MAKRRIEFEIKYCPNCRRVTKKNRALHVVKRCAYCRLAEYVDLTAIAHYTEPKTTKSA